MIGIASEELAGVFRLEFGFLKWSSRGDRGLADIGRDVREILALHARRGWLGKSLMVVRIVFHGGGVLTLAGLVAELTDPGE
jgi:hypothetical protein